ncbi:hypothetical protein SKAU_G00293040 [Synaphobranchus kaupii]|uniref:Uncharacterized protein n=1 Tax=Synaphobranchus kaupii TaxID=118154 RepID=A0A9Q1EU59_SYNKA|nr:hypothetical protein SKAU_G00293040 [Synaphobranchus kaupii]
MGSCRPLAGLEARLNCHVPSSYYVSISQTASNAITEHNLCTSTTTNLGTKHGTWRLNKQCLFPQKTFQIDFAAAYRTQTQAAQTDIAHPYENNEASDLAEERRRSTSSSHGKRKQRCVFIPVGLSSFRIAPRFSCPSCLLGGRTEEDILTLHACSLGRKSVRSKLSFFLGGDT